MRIVVFPLNPPCCNEFRLIYIRAEIQFDGRRAGVRHWFHYAACGEGFWYIHSKSLTFPRCARQTLSLSICTFGERRREKKIGKGSSERAADHHCAIKSNHRRGSKGHHHFCVCAWERDREGLSIAHRGSMWTKRDRLTPRWMQISFVRLAAMAGKLHTHVYICASSSLFGFALGRNGDVSRTKALAAQHVCARKSLSLCATERVCCRFN